MFKHKTDLNIPEIKAKTTDGIRLYETQKVSSILLLQLF